MKKRTAKGALSLLLALVMVLGLLPAAAFAAEDTRPSIAVPPKNGGFTSIRDLLNAYTLRAINLNEDRVSIDAGMHVGFRGNNVTDPKYNPAYTDPDEWSTASFPNRAGTYRTAIGVLSPIEFKPFAIKAKADGGAQYVPVIAMVDNASADYLLNARDGSYNFKRWANSLTARDYDPANPQRGTMVVPHGFVEDYVHAYNNYPADPVNLLSYLYNPGSDDKGLAKAMSLLVDAVPYEANALSLKITGTDYVAVAPAKQDDMGQDHYDYTGPAVVTVTVTNTASYPVLAELSHSGAVFTEIEGASQGGEDWNPGHEYDRLSAMSTSSDFYGVHYLPAGASLVRTIAINSSPYANPEGRAFTRNVVSSIDVTVKNVTNYLGSDGIPDGDKSVTVSHSTAWQGSGQENQDYISIVNSQNSTYQVSPQVIALEDIYNKRVVKSSDMSWTPAESVYTPNEITFTGPQLSGVTRILAVVKLLDDGYGISSTELPLTADNITKGSPTEVYRQDRSRYGSREVVLSFTSTGGYEPSRYRMVPFKESALNGPTYAYTTQELEAMSKTELTRLLSGGTNWYSAENFPFTYDGAQITLTLPEKYFTEKTEQMHKQLSDYAAKYGGKPEQIDFYFLTASDTDVVPTTLELPYWMYGDINRPAVFKDKADPHNADDYLNTFNSYSLYNFRRLPGQEDYNSLLARKPTATVYFENSADTSRAVEFGKALYLHQSDNKNYTISASPRSGTPLISFTGSNLSVMKGNGGGTTSARLGRPYSYYIPAGALMNQRMLVRANPYAASSGEPCGVYLHSINNGKSWEVWSEGCDILVNGKVVMQDFQIVLDAEKRYNVEYLSEELAKGYERVEVKPFSWRGGQNVADSISLIEGGFLSGDVHGAYLYKDSIGLDITMKDPEFLPLDAENILGLGDVKVRAEVRVPAQNNGNFMWEVKTDGKSTFNLGGANYIFFTAEADLEFEANTFRETPEADRFINISGNANLLDLLRVGVVCNYKMVGNAYVFDKIYIRGGSDLIGLPPLVPILQISDVGGGIDGLADTLAHSNWDYIPPLTLNLDASVALTVKVLEISADRAGVVFGLSKLGVYADSLAIKAIYGTGEDDNISVDLLRNLEMTSSWDLKDTQSKIVSFPVPVYELYMQGGIELLDFLSGNASLLVIVDTAELLDAAYKAANNEGVLTEFLAWKQKYEETKAFDYEGLARILNKSNKALLNELFVQNDVFSVEGNAWGNINIPSKVPIIGGYELANGEAGISYHAPTLTLQASGAYDIFIKSGQAGVIFTYNVETGRHDVDLLRRSMGPSGEEGYTVTIEGLNYRDVPIVQVPVEPQPVPLAGPEALDQTDAADPEHADVPEASAPDLSPNAMPALLTNTPAPFATAEAFQITSQAGDDVVFAEFLASEKVEITITSDADNELKYTIPADSPQWVPVYVDDNAKDKEIKAYRYTFQFYEEGQSIHGDGDKTGGYIWTATATDPDDANKLTACNVATIDPPEAISAAGFSGNSVTFTANHLKDGHTYTAGVSLVHESDYNGGKPKSEGTPVGQRTSVTAGNNAIPLNANYAQLVQSGEYHAVVHLERTKNGEENVPVRLSTSAVSAGTLTVANPNAPGAISGTLTPEYIGDGALSFTLPAPDARTTGYELRATKQDGAPITIPCFDNEGNMIYLLDEDGNPTDKLKLVDAFATPATYPLKTLKDGTITIAADGSRLKAGETYQFTFTPYHQPEDSSSVFYGPATTLDVAFPSIHRVNAAVEVGRLDGEDVWKQLDAEPGDTATRYVAQEHLVYLPQDLSATVAVGDPKTTDITFSAEGVRSMKIVAMGDAFAQRDSQGVVTNNKTRTFTVTSDEGPGGSLSQPFTIPLSAGEHMFTVTTVSAAGDTNTQTFVFTVDGADIQFAVESHSFDPVALGSESGQTFTFEALLEEGAKVIQVGTKTGLSLTPIDGKVSWTGDPAVKPTVLAADGDTPIAWAYTVPITVQDADGFTATQALSYEVFDPAADANFPSRLELSVYPGARLNPGVKDAKVSVTAVTASGTVAVDSSKVTFASSDENVLTVGEDGTIKILKEGAATITATYKTGKDLGEGRTFTPRTSLPVTVIAENAENGVKPTPTLRVTSVTADSITVELGPVNAASVTLSLVQPSQSASLTTGLDGSQFHTFSGLSAGRDYSITAMPDGSYYAAATVRATTDLPVPAGAMYTVTYARDGADGGSAPVDPNRYAKGDTVDLLTSVIPLFKNGAEVLGFSTAPNGGGTRYLYADMTAAAPRTFVMGEADVTLYPIWPAGGSTGGSGSSAAPQPTFPGGKGWSGVEKALDALDEGGTLTVDMNGATTLPASVLEAIAGKDVKLELDMGGGAVWVIQGSDVPATGLSDLNLGVNTKANTIPVAVIDAATGAQTTLQVELSHSGPFGMSLTLRMELGADHAGRWANLYYYDEAEKTLDFRAHSLISGRGWAELPFDHASSYAVVIDDAPHGPWENPFTDVGAADWFYEAARYVHLGGLFAGTSETTFSPNVTMSRAMLWTVLARLDGQDTQGGATWYEKGRTWAMAQGVTDGTDPEGQVTREQVAAMLYRYAQAKGLDVSKSADLTAFADGERVSSWAVEALAWANAAGVITGKPGGLLDPQGQATRAEAAAMLMRCALSTGA